MIQKQVKLNGSLDSPETSPVKHLLAEINGRKIYSYQSIIESELLLPHPALNPKPIKEFPEDLLIEFPGTMLMAIGQGRTGKGSNSQMPQLSFTTPKSFTHLPEGMSLARLAEQHRDESHQRLDRNPLG